MSPALTRGLKKALRTAAQMVATGGLTALVNTLAGGISGTAAATVAAAWMFVVTFTQNWLESAKVIPTLFPTLPIPLLGVTGGGVTGVDPAGLIGKHLSD